MERGGGGREGEGEGNERIERGDDCLSMRGTRRIHGSKTKVKEREKEREDGDKDGREKRVLPQ